MVGEPADYRQDAKERTDRMLLYSHSVMYNLSDAKPYIVSFLLATLI